MKQKETNLAKEDDLEQRRVLGSVCPIDKQEMLHGLHWELCHTRQDTSARVFTCFERELRLLDGTMTEENNR